MKTTVLFLILLLAVPLHALAEGAGLFGKPSLGNFHITAKYGLIYFDDDAERVWGIDDENYLGVEFYAGMAPNFYFGLEVGGAEAENAGGTVGDFFSSVDFLSLEANMKVAFALARGVSLDVGGGYALIWIEGEEVSYVLGVPVTTKVADVGQGLQVFMDVNWRLKMLLLGLDAKYQYAFDVWGLDYSNFRFGAHAGFAF